MGIINLNVLRGTVCELRGATPNFSKLALSKALDGGAKPLTALAAKAAPAEHSAAAAVDDLANSGRTYLPEANAYVDDVSGATSGARRGADDVDGSGGYDEMGNASRGSDWGSGGVYDESGGGYYGDF